MFGGGEKNRTQRTHFTCRDAWEWSSAAEKTQPRWFSETHVKKESEKKKKKSLSPSLFWFQGTIRVLCLALSLTFLHPTVRLDAMCWKAWHHYHWQTFSNKSPAFSLCPFKTLLRGVRRISDLTRCRKSHFFSAGIFSFFLSFFFFAPASRHIVWNAVLWHFFFSPNAGPSVFDKNSGSCFLCTFIKFWSY